MNNEAFKPPADQTMQLPATDVGTAAPRTSLARVGETVAPEAWCDLIVHRCGVVFREGQVPGVTRAIRDQMRFRGIASPAAYYEMLAKEPEGGPEWTGLLERLLNHETSFFRHPPSFDVFRSLVLPALRDASGRGSQLSFWSAGCSTGQEAYSLAMVALADAELGGRFTVWGSDISRQAIDTARRGRYGPRAVASVPPEPRKRFLRDVTTDSLLEYEVVDEVRQHVRFMPINLFAACGISMNHDVIFCHNVLIYFAPAAANQLVVLLATRLKPGGYLMLGPGECPSQRPPGLEPLSLGTVRAFRRAGQRAIEARP